MEAIYATLTEALTDIAGRSFYESADVIPNDDGTFTVRDSFDYADDVTWTYADGIDAGTGERWTTHACMSRMSPTIPPITFDSISAGQFR